MRQSDRVDVLRRVPLFADLSKKQVAAVTRQMTEIRMGAGSVIAKEGDAGREAMVLLSGTAVVRRGDRDIAELGPGDVVGEMSLINQEPRNATVTTTTDATLLLMTSREFEQVLAASPDISFKILKTVAARLAENS